MESTIPLRIACSEASSKNQIRTDGPTPSLPLEGLLRHICVDVRDGLCPWPLDWPPTRLETGQATVRSFRRDGSGGNRSHCCSTRSSQRGRRPSSPLTSAHIPNTSRFNPDGQSYQSTVQHEGWTAGPETRRELAPLRRCRALGHKTGMPSEPEAAIFFSLPAGLSS
jgi:hypothetical protein